MLLLVIGVALVTNNVALLCAPYYIVHMTSLWRYTQIFKNINWLCSIVLMMYVQFLSYILYRG